MHMASLQQSLRGAVFEFWMTGGALYVDHQKLGEISVKSDREAHRNQIPEGGRLLVAP